MNDIIQKKNISTTSIKVGDTSKCSKGVLMYGDDTVKKKVLPTSKQIFVKPVVVSKKRKRNY